MKFTDNQKRNEQQKTQNTQSKMEGASFEHIEMLSQSEEQADKLQADVVNGCGRVIFALNSCEVI